MGLAVALGGTCLGGIPCEQGNVLYLALEDNERRLQKRIDKVLGPLHDWPASFQYATEWPRANDGGIDAIREWIIEASRPRLIIVDVLAMFRPTSGARDNLYETDYHAIKGLQGLASEYGVAIVVVHHTRKGSGAEADPFEKVSGTLGLSGAADTTIVLDRDGNGATIYGRGRDIEEIESAVEFEKDTCRWRVLGQASEVRRTDERSAILSVLEDADEAMGPGEIAKATGVACNNINQLLYKMAKAGEVRKSKRGRYVHPNRLDLIGDFTPTPDKNDKKIRKEDDALASMDGHEPGLLIAADPADKKPKSDDAGRKWPKPDPARFPPGTPLPTLDDLDDETRQELCQHYRNLKPALRHKVLRYWALSGTPTAFLDELEREADA